MDGGAGPDPGGDRDPVRSSCSISSTGRRTPTMTIKAIGHQWYWTYEYPDHGNFTFDSQPDHRQGDLKPGQLRLLETDNHMVVPVDTKVRLLITGDRRDPFLGDALLRRQADAVPGRINETWFAGRARGHLLRPVLRALRHQPRLHADRGRGGVARRSSTPGSARRRRNSRRRTAAPARRRLRRRPASAAARTDRFSEGRRTMSHGRTSTHADARPRPSPDRLAAVRLFDQPQGHRHDVPGASRSSPA